ncbi:MAG: GNAT family N-acetyltransferase [Vicinamibacteria bacterium]
MRTRPLTDVSPREVRALLDEESDHWHGELYWDYRDVSHAVASGLERRSLQGWVIQDGPRSVAYCYHMLDGGRAIVGSLFAASGFRGQGLEEALLDCVLSDAQRRPGNDRVECQTLFSTAQSADGRFARAGFRSRGRHYLVRDLRQPVGVPSPGAFSLRPLRREDVPTAARVIHGSHQGSLDAALNLTYATPALCRSFVETLVLRAGCGRFDPEASFVAVGDGGPVGVILASHLSRTNGHVCQVSVAPEAQGRGLGALLMTSALRAFRGQGLSTASLSVTVENRHAYRLYERLGFRLRKEFAAHAWVRPPARIEIPA